MNAEKRRIGKRSIDSIKLSGVVVVPSLRVPLSTATWAPSTLMSALMVVLWLDGSTLSVLVMARSPTLRPS